MFIPCTYLFVNPKDLMHKIYKKPQLFSQDFQWFVHQILPTPDIDYKKHSILITVHFVYNF